MTRRLREAGTVTRDDAEPTVDPPDRAGDSGQPVWPSADPALAGRSAGLALHGSSAQPRPPSAVLRTQRRRTRRCRLSADHRSAGRADAGVPAGERTVRHQRQFRPQPQEPPSGRCTRAGLADAATEPTYRRPRRSTGTSSRPARTRRPRRRRATGSSASPPSSRSSSACWPAPVPAATVVALDDNNAPVAEQPDAPVGPARIRRSAADRSPRSPPPCCRAWSS